jgi:hypothetical protein
MKVQMCLNGRRDGECTLTRVMSNLWMLLLVVVTFAASICSVSAATSAEAQRTIYRCIGRQGVVSYQDVPCPHDQRMSTVHRFKTAMIDPVLSARSRAIEQEMDLRNRGHIGALRVSVPRSQKQKPPSRCETAKAKRETFLQKLGFRRDFALMSAIDRAVWDACQGL